MLAKFSRPFFRTLIAGAVICSLCAATPVHKHKHAKPVATKKLAKKIHVATVAALPSSSDSIQQGIDQILSGFSHNLNVGVIVQSTTTGETLYQHNADHVFTPASTLKLFTASAALSYLGPDYVFPTQFLSGAMPQNGIIPGNLYAKFTGDPLLTTQALETMVATLSQNGVREISGNLIIDDTTLDRSNWAPGMLDDDQLLCYAAPATSIILNRNCFGFSVATNSHNPHQVRINQTLADISIINQTITRRTSTLVNLKPTGVDDNTFVLNGYLRPNHPVSLAVALNNPRQAGTNILVNMLKKHGITLEGTVQYGKAPGNLRLLAQHDSQPLSYLVTYMLKKSVNIIADTLFKTLGGVYFNTSGGWTNGSQAVRAILEPKMNINFSKIVMVDGAGLSRYDLVSPEEFATLLQYDFHTLPAKAVFFNALPRSGVDGTLRFRMGGATQDKIHAKTGTMKSTNTSGLAGYVLTANNQTLTFAILVNAQSGNQGTYHLLEDRICQFLASKTV